MKKTGRRLEEEENEKSRSREDDQSQKIEGGKRKRKKGGKRYTERFLPATNHKNKRSSYNTISLRTHKHKVHLLAVARAEIEAAARAEMGIKGQRGGVRKRENVTSLILTSLFNCSADYNSQQINSKDLSS